jgi:chaperonin GroEL (HSP60 family)
MQVDPLDTQVLLRTNNPVYSSEIKYGIDIVNAKVSDITILQDIYEPLAVKENVINVATEAANMILRIDNIISESKTKNATSRPSSAPLCFLLRFL